MLREIMLSRTITARWQHQADDQDAYQIRVGDYRIIYSIQDRQLLVIVIEVGHQRDIYRHK